MSEPDTNVMRATYATAATYRQSPDPGRATEFDRWLAQVKAEAWDEGYNAGELCGLTAEQPDHACPTNPYRREVK